MPEFNVSSPEKEIKELEKLIQKKREALKERRETKEDREIFKDAFRERYGDKFQISKETVISETSPNQPIPIDESLRQEQRERRVNNLIQIAFQEGIEKAVKEARKSSPWLLDELHDRLIDEYYQKLVQAQI